MNNQRGFTLIELILALVVSGILAVMLSTYLGASLSKSNDPLVHLRDTLDIYSVMERIHMTYEYSDQTLSDLQTAVGDAGSNPQNNAYGSYDVLYNDFVECNAAATTIFTGGTGSSLLMITIADPASPGIKVTSLFSE